MLLIYDDLAVMNMLVSVEISQKRNHTANVKLPRPPLASETAGVIYGALANKSVSV